MNFMDDASGSPVGLRVVVKPPRGGVGGKSVLRCSGQWPASSGSRLELSGARPLGHRLVGARGLFSGFRA